MIAHITMRIENISTKELETLQEQINALGQAWNTTDFQITLMPSNNRQFVPIETIMKEEQK